jgi:hypothetical protein
MDTRLTDKESEELRFVPCIQHGARTSYKERLVLAFVRGARLYVLNRYFVIANPTAAHEPVKSSANLQKEAYQLRHLGITASNLSAPTLVKVIGTCNYTELSSLRHILVSAPYPGG